MSETYLLRIFVPDAVPGADPDADLGVGSTAADSGCRPDGALHGVAIRLATGRELPFRDDAGLLAAIRRLAADQPRRLLDGPDLIAEGVAVAQAQDTA